MKEGAKQGADLGLKVEERRVRMIEKYTHKKGTVILKLKS